MDHVDIMRELHEKWTAAMGSGHFDARHAGQRSAAYDSQHSIKGSSKINDETYWDIVARSMKHPNDAPNVARILQEEETKRFTANPVGIETLGMDQAPVVTPNWTDGEELKKLTQMKLDLHALGDKLAAADTNIEEAKAKSLLNQIKSLQEKIDELSDSLAPDIKKDAQS